MTTPFDYPRVPHVRRHGPLGYADYASYRPWLRDEFSFHCVYCLLREQWGWQCSRRLTTSITFTHWPITPVSALITIICSTPARPATSRRGAGRFPIHLLVLTSPNVQVGEDGVLRAATPDAARLIKILGLNGTIAIEFRLLWIGIVALAAKGDPDLYRRLMGFPADLPDLQSLQPPGGNRRPEGIGASYIMRRREPRRAT